MRVVAAARTVCHGGGASTASSHGAPRLPLFMETLEEVQVAVWPPQDNPPLQAWAGPQSAALLHIAVRPLDASPPTATVCVGGIEAPPAKAPPPKAEAPAVAAPPQQCPAPQAFSAPKQAKAKPPVLQPEPTPTQAPQGNKTEYNTERKRMKPKQHKEYQSRNNRTNRNKTN